MINEQQIDEVIDQLSESDDVFEAHLDALQEEQPMLLSYLFAEDNEAFTNEEREYLIFLSVVIWQAFRRARHTQRVPTAEEISVSRPGRLAISANISLEGPPAINVPRRRVAGGPRLAAG